jgi:hypothetical protein
MSANTTQQITSLTVLNDSFINGLYATQGIVTPTTLSSTPIHNYSPTGIENSTILRLSASSPVTITGLDGGINGRRMTLININIIPITITSEDTNSDAENRFALGGVNARLVSGAVLGIVYDGTINRWRVNSATAGAATPGGLVQSVWAEVEIDTDTSVTTWPTPNSPIEIAATLPTGTIRIEDESSFLASGNVLVLNTDGNVQELSYTSTTGGANPTLNGVVGGEGTLPIGSIVWQRPFETMIAAASDGDELPQATINVDDTTNFPSSGALLVTSSGGQQNVEYTGITATTFTGCTGGVGTINTGNEVRDVSPNVQDLVRLELTPQGGALIIISAASTQTTNNQIAYFQILVDNLVIRGGAASGNGGAPGGSTVIGLKLDNVPAGDHVAVLRWRISGGSSELYPVTLAEVTNANMLIQEVSS